jgi:hypothetical protein
MQIHMLHNKSQQTSINTTSKIEKNENLSIIRLKLKLHGLSPRVNYTDRATAACRRSDCQLVRIEGATWSA